MRYIFLKLYNKINLIIKVKYESYASYITKERINDFDRAVSYGNWIARINDGMDKV